MKIANTIIKILTALATIAGIVYIVATYGEQIVAWAKKIWSKMPQCPSCEEAVTVEEAAEEAEEAAEEAEEAPEAAEVEVAAEEVSVEEAVEEAPEVIVAENEPVAAEEDFAE